MIKATLLVGVISDQVNPICFRIAALTSVLVFVDSRVFSLTAL